MVCQLAVLLCHNKMRSIACSKVLRVIAVRCPRTNCSMQAYVAGGAGASVDTAAACLPGGTLYNLDAGTYIWTVFATDNAGAVCTGRGADSSESCSGMLLH